MDATCGKHLREILREFWLQTKTKEATRKI